MASYNLNRKQLDQVARLIADRAPYLAELIAKGISANAQHCRPSAVSLAIKIARNKDVPTRIEVEVQPKIKAPRSRYSDLTSWDEAEIIIAFRIDQDPNQQAVPGTEGNGEVKKTADEEVVVDGLDNAGTASAAADGRGD